MGERNSLGFTCANCRLIDYRDITESNVKMSAANLVDPPGFSLQHPNLTPSHAKYSNVGSRSQAHVIYYYIGFKSSSRFLEPLSDGHKKFSDERISKMSNNLAVYCSA
jgi:hypothetical protein